MKRPYIEFLTNPSAEAAPQVTIDGVRLSDILKLNKTPCYITSLSAVGQRAEAYVRSLKSAFSNSIVFYAFKANAAQPILKELIAKGCGADIVSIGEWRAALRAGFPPHQICFAGVGKKQKEWEEAIKGGLGYLNVEHMLELEHVLLFLSQQKNSKTHVALRINPCLELKTHPHLRTGSLDSKFGILFKDVKQGLLELKAKHGEIQHYFAPLNGLHFHIGSQIENPEILEQVVETAFTNANELIELGLRITHLDFGGGLHVGAEGVPHDAKDIETHIAYLKKYAESKIQKYPRLHALWGNNFENLEFCLEPGRSIVASSTVYLTQVLYEKRNSEEHLFCYVDAGMNDFPRPSLYGAKHEVVPVHFVKTPTRNTSTLFKYQIVGPVCESADFLARDVLLPHMQPGDALLFFEAGAYCFAMASHYNLRPLPAQVFVKDGNIKNIIESKEPT